MPRSKNRREARTSSGDPTRRHRKKTGFRGAPSSDKLSSSAKDNADMARPTYLETFCIQMYQFAYLRGTLLVGQYDYEVVHRRSIGSILMPTDWVADRRKRSNWRYSRLPTTYKFTMPPNVGRGGQRRQIKFTLLARSPYSTAFPLII